MTTLWSHDCEIQEIARKVPDPLSRKAGSGNETMANLPATGSTYKVHGCGLGGGLQGTCTKNFLA